MDLNEHQRADLASRVRSVRLSRYRGNRKAAYTDAGVNSATWERAEKGAPLAERSLVAIIETLWPETAGDWQLLDPPLSGEVVDVAEEVRRSNLHPKAKDYILQFLDENPPPPPDEEVRGA